MKRKKKIVITVVLTTSMLVLLGMVFSYKERSGHKCRTCHSYRSYSKWAIGDCIGPSVTIWSREIITKSTIYKILFTETHKHDWELVHRESYSIFIHRYASGGANRSEFVIYYEDLPPFREFIDKKIAEKELTLDQLYQIIALPSKSFEKEDTDAHTSELAHLAKQLVNEGDKQL